MKSRSLLVLALILSLAVVPSAQLALGAASSSSSSSSTTSTTSAAPSTPFTQRLDVYVAGSNDYWVVTLNPVNASRAAITAAESVAGVSAYQLTAVAGSASTVGSLLFFSGAYNVARLPTLPYSGVFLNVTATSLPAAQSVASNFDKLFGTYFAQTGSGGGNYTFFAQVGFSSAGATLYSMVPVADQGLATVTNESAWVSDPTPVAVLTGVRSGSSFTHVLRFGATATGTLGSNSSFLLENALSINKPSFVTSPNATSTQVVVHSLDGLIQSKDNATLTNNVANFTGRYSITLPDNTSFRPNMTLVQNPPVATATRSIDNGAPSQGGIVTVTINVVDSSYNGTLQDVSVNDNWWAAYPSLFSLNAGSSNFTIPSITPEQNVSRAYSLKVLSSAAQDVIIPAAKVSFSYAAGGTNVTESAYTNQAEVRVNEAGPALQVHAESSLLSGSSLGKSGSYLVSVTNTGNLPALNLNSMNYTDPTLTPGGTWTFNMSLPLSSIADRNLTQTFTVGYTAPDGTTGSVVSNPDQVILSHTTMDLPLEEFKLVATVTAQQIAQGSVNASYVLVNRGNAVAHEVAVTQALPTGMTCAAVPTGNGTCGSSGFSLSATSVAVLGNVTGTVTLNFTKENFITPSAVVTTTQAGGLQIVTLGSSLALPGGMAVTKSFSPDRLFQGQQSNTTLLVTNSGSLPVYNVSLSSSADTFDSVVTGSEAAQYPVLAPDSSQSANYTVKMTGPGNHTSTSTTVSFVFAGQTIQYPVSSGTVLVYQPVVASTSTVTNPEEGADFSLAVYVQNPSPANVTNVSVSITLPAGISVVSAPSGFQVSGRNVTLSLPALAAGANATGTLTLKSELDGTFNIAAGALKFQYLGSTVGGTVSSPAISVGIGSLLKFEIFIAAAVVLLLLAAVYMHRKLVAPQK